MVYLIQDGFMLDYSGPKDELSMKRYYKNLDFSNKESWKPVPDHDLRSLFMRVYSRIFNFSSMVFWTTIQSPTLYIGVLVVAIIALFIAFIYLFATSSKHVKENMTNSGYQNEREIQMTQKLALKSIFINKKTKPE